MSVYRQLKLIFLTRKVKPVKVKQNSYSMEWMETRIESVSNYISLKIICNVFNIIYAVH